MELSSRWTTGLGYRCRILARTLAPCPVFYARYTSIPEASDRTGVSVRIDVIAASTRIDPRRLCGIHAGRESARFAATL